MTDDLLMRTLRTLSYAATIGAIITRHRLSDACPAPDQCFIHVTNDSLDLMRSDIKTLIIDLLNDHGI